MPVDFWIFRNACAGAILNMRDIFRKIPSNEANKRFIAVVLASLLIKSILIANATVVNGDAIRYFNSAHQLLQGNIPSAFSHEKMLFYTFVLGIFKLIFRDWEFSGYLLSLVFLTLTLIPLYFFTKEVFGANAAIWTAIAFCLIPSINELTVNVVKDAPFLFFAMTALFFAYKALESSKYTAFLLTFSCALMATLFRFEGLIFLGSYILWLLLNIVFRSSLRPAAYRGVLLFSVVLVVGLSVFIGLNLFFGPSWSEMIWIRFREHYFQTNLLNGYQAIYGHLREVENNFSGGQWTNDFFEIARYNLPLIYLLGILQVLASAIFPAYLVPLYLGVKLSRLSKGGVRLLCWMVVTYLLLAYFFIVTRNFLAERYLIIVVVMLLPLAGSGFEQFLESLSIKRFRTIANIVIVICFLFIPLYRTFIETRTEKAEIRYAGMWLKTSGKAAHSKLITTDERIPFYSGLWRDKYQIFPEGTGGNFEAVAIDGNYSIMVLDMAPRNVASLPKFEKYALIKEFRGNKKTILIYERKSA